MLKGLETGNVSVLVILCLLLIAPLSGIGVAQAQPSTAASTQAGSISAATESVQDQLENESGVRENASVIIENASTTYGFFYERRLNAEWWDDRGEKKAQEVANIDFTEVFLGEVEGELATRAVSAASTGGGKVVSGLGTAQSLYDLGKRTNKLYTAVQSDVVASQMRLPESYESLRPNIKRLRENAEQFDQKTTVSERKKLLQERRSLLKETYRLLPTYLSQTYSTTVENPAYSIELLPGTDWRYGTTTYTNIRTGIEEFRLLLALDYRATEAYLTDEKSKTHLANAAGGSQPVTMPTHNLHFSQQTARVYDTIDTPNEYSLYRVEVGESMSGPGKELQVRLRTNTDRNFTGYLSESRIDPTDPAGKKFTAAGDTQATIPNVDAGSYYVLINTSNRSLPYTLLASVYDPAFFDLVKLDRRAPQLTVTEKGFGQVEESEQPERPKPQLSCACITPTESGFLVNIQATNKGAPSDWQSIAAGVPELENKSAVEIVDHNLDSASKFDVGSKLGATYGTRVLNNSTYPLIEGYVEDWDTNEDHYLRLRITPPEDGNYTIQTKSVGQSNGVWWSDPAVGATNTTDQQSEYVVEKTYTYQSTQTEPNNSWTSKHDGLTNNRNQPNLPVATHNVSERWRSIVDGRLASSPLVVNDSVFATTRNGRVIGIDRSDGTVSWTFDTGSGIRSAPTYANGALYVSTSNRVYVLNSKTGDSLCDCSFTLNDNRASSPVVVNDTLFVTTRDNNGNGHVYAFDVPSRERLWRNGFGNEPIHSPPTVTESTIYITTTDGNVHALDRATGSVRWTSNVGNKIVHAPLLHDGRIYVGTTGGTVNSLSRQTGEIRWSYHVGRSIDHVPVVDADRVYVAASDHLYALNEDGTWQWTSAVGGDINTAPVKSRDTIMVGSREAKRLYGIDPSDGSRRFSHLTSGIRGELAVTAGQLYYGAAQSVYAVTGATGAPTAHGEVATAAPKINETVQFDGAASSDPDGSITVYEWDLDDDGNFEETGESISTAFSSPGAHTVKLRVTDDSGGTDTTRISVVVDGSQSSWKSARATSQQTGSNIGTYGPTHDVNELWENRIEGTVSGTPAIVDGTVYVGTTANKVYALSRTTGEKRWSMDVGGTPTSPVVENETVYVSAEDERVYAIDKLSGEVRWSRGAGLRHTERVIVRDSTVYVVTWQSEGYRRNDKTHVRAINTSDGSLRWTRTYGNNKFRSSPTVTEETVYLTDQNGNVRGLDRETGDRRWVTNVGAGVRTPAVISNDRLFIGDTSGDIHALNAQTGAKQWEYHAGTGIRKELAVTDKRLFAVGNDRLYAFDRDGNWKWSHRVRADISTAPVAVNGTIYIGSANAKRLFALDSTDGSQRWKAYTGTVQSQPAVTNTRIYLGARDSIYAYKGNTTAPRAFGTVRPVRPDPGQPVTLNASDSFDPDGSIVSYAWDLDDDGKFEDAGETTTTIFTSPGDHPVTLRVTGGDGAADTTQLMVETTQSGLSWNSSRGDPQQTGAVEEIHGPTSEFTQAWDFKTDGQVNTAPTFSNGTLYVGTTANSVYALNRTSGEQRWEISVGGTVENTVIVGDTVYASAENERVYAIDKLSGEVRWSRGAGLRHTERVTVHNSTVYVVTWQSEGYRRNDKTHVRAINTSDGSLRWTRTYGNNKFRSSPTVTADTVYLTDRNGNVRALDRETGDRRWVTNVGAGVRTPAVISEGQLFVGDTSGNVHALNAQTGSKQWRYHGGGGIQTPLAVTQTQIFAVDGDRLYALDRDGNWKWSHRVAADISTAPVAVNGTVYIGSSNAKQVYAIDASDGTKQGEFYTGTVHSQLTVKDTALYLGARQSIYAYTGKFNPLTARLEYQPNDPTLGQSVKFEASASVNPTGSITSYEWDLDDDGTFERSGETITTSFTTPGDHPLTLRVANQNGSTDTTSVLLEVTNTTGGETKRTGMVRRQYRPTSGPTHNITEGWTFDIGESAVASSTITPETVYVAAIDNTIHALNRTSGEQRWELKVGSTPENSVVAGDTVYVSAENERVYAVDKLAGEVRWSRGAGLRHTERVIVRDSTVYVVTWQSEGYRRNDKTHVRAINTSDGSLRWTRTYGNNKFRSSPTVTEETVYLTDQNGNIRALDRETGDRWWVTNVGSGIKTPPVVVGKGVFVGDTAGNVYRIDAETGRETWETNVGFGIDHHLAVGPDRVYVTSGDHVTGLATDTGEIVWNSSSVRTSISTHPTVTNTTVYAGSASSHQVYAFDIIGGSLRWDHVTRPLKSDIQVDSNSVYFGAGHSMYRLTGDTGAPSAQFEYSPHSPASNETVRFTANDSVDVDGNVTRFAWDFDGDGSADARGSNVTHQFSSAGTQRVTLTVIDDDGNPDTRTRSITIPDTKAPTAELLANTTVVEASQPVRFDASESSDNVGVTDYQWRFENETYVNASSTVVRSFDKPGDYTVVVRARDAANNTNTTFATVSVVSSFSQNLSASRTMQNATRPGEPVAVNVTISPNVTVDGLTFSEDLPTGFQIISESTSPGATYNEAETDWFWESGQPGETYHVNYTVNVPTNATFGESFRFKGVASAYNQTPTPTTGTNTLRITACPDRVVAGSDRRISLSELQRAAHWWQTQTIVPDTGDERLSLSQLQRLVHKWKRNETVSCDSPSGQGVTTVDGAALSTEQTQTGSESLLVTQQLSDTTVSPGEAITVTLSIDPAGSDGPAMVTEIPPNWSIRNQTVDGGTYSDGAWIWLSTETHEVTYTLEIAESASTGNYSLGVTGSGIDPVTDQFRNDTVDTTITVDDGDTKTPSFVETRIVDQSDGDGAVTSGDTVRIAARVKHDDTIRSVTANATQFGTEAPLPLRDENDNGTYQATFTVGGNVDNGTANVSVTAADATGSNATTVTSELQISTQRHPLDPFASSDGTIDIEGLLDGIDAFRADEITVNQLLELIKIWRSGGTVP
ncbi:PQQ-binding-like beta-propeller repeat protein (plasmid) [Halorientalis pallida]|uniref:outer membrane protein assembly factor BamB family protein n=1 Tax=Halorientalis pallida TaxID=2479928 RepID=UPI003C70282F